jgi:uncharacterized protein involved in tolerance to divalent cations
MSTAPTDVNGEPMEAIEHDVNIARVTADEFHSAQRFIRACDKMARLKQGEFADDAGFYVAELTHELALTAAKLIDYGDLILARRLASAVEIFQRAANVYGWKISGRVEKRLSIKNILKKHKARPLLEMVSALHPAWDKLLRIPNRHDIESLSEAKLRKLLISKERWIHEQSGAKEWRKHRLAEIIENIIAVRETENENINLFVEYLWHGWLWSGPAATLVKCPWHGEKNLPTRDDVPAWMNKIMPFLRDVTGNDPMKLGVFNRLIAARRFVYHDASGEGFGRLATDSSKYIWNQVQTEIRKAWITMEKWVRKPHFSELA